jgi:hypothetical protein
MALDATVGGASSNSYLTLAAAEAYFLGRLSTGAWDDADEDEREAALIMATSRLDREAYQGCIVSSTQRLQWPRSFVPTRTTGWYSSAAIPQPVQDATCELALALLNDPAMFDAASGLLEFDNLSLGSLSVTPRAAPSTALPWSLLRILGDLRIGGFMNRVMRA